MAVDSYPRGPLSDLSPIITGKPGNIPFPCCWKRGGGGEKKKNWRGYYSVGNSRLIANEEDSSAP